MLEIYNPMGSVNPFGASPLIIGEQHGAQLGQLLRRILQPSEHERPLVKRQREQLHLGFERTLKPIGQVVGSGITDEVGELFNGFGDDGQAREHHPGSVRGLPE